MVHLRFEVWHGLAQLSCAKHTEIIHIHSFISQDKKVGSAAPYPIRRRGIPAQSHVSSPFN